MARASGILGVDHVAVFTARVEEAERHYGELFGASVLFRGTSHRGVWVGLDAVYGWKDIRRRGIRVEASFLRAGGLTVIVANDSSPGKAGPGKGGPLDHVGIGCSEAEFRRIRELVRAKALRVLEDGPEGFKFRDDFGLTWEVSRGMDAARRPEKMLDLGTGRVT